jgi:hypothetical protein
MIQVEMAECWPVQLATGFKPPSAHGCRVAAGHSISIETTSHQSAASPVCGSAGRRQERLDGSVIEDGGPQMPGQREQCLVQYIKGGTGCHRTKDGFAMWKRIAL